MKISEFKIKIQKENVLHFLDCMSNNPLYEELLKKCEALEAEFYHKLTPHALLEFGTLPKSLETQELKGGTQVLYMIASIGTAISEWSSSLFAEGNYMAGMLVNAMADDYLFQLDSSVKEYIINLCKKRNFGVIKRFEAPTDINIKVQAEALRVTKAKEELGIELTKHFMFSPVKTICQIYALEENGKEYHMEHNCQKCDAISCKMRQKPLIHITIEEAGEKTRQVIGKKNHSIFQTLLEHGIDTNAICGGKGTCGKCFIRLKEGKLEPSFKDLSVFSEKEIKEGFRLSCLAYPKEDCTISIKTQKEDFMVVSEYREKNIKHHLNENVTYGIGVDIGTTTIAMQLVEQESGKIMDTYTAINRQKFYGADVISRIDASNQGKEKNLQESIRKDIKTGVHVLLENKKLSVVKMVLAGNTTMIHLLMGYSCKTLGIFPFTPVNLNVVETTYEELFQDANYHIPVMILPGISAFVGGDIVAGLFAANFDTKEKVSLLIDLGTNGEMAIGNQDHILVTSTAAGPAFEGGNITWGVGSVRGAICHLLMQEGTFSIETIQNAPPIGLCGTGVIEVIVELMKEKIIDESGLLAEKFFEEGYLITHTPEGKKIILTQKDIREIQLAKAAIQAGIETLLLRYGISSEQVEQVYIAGGFGYKMDIEKAMSIGLLPKVFWGKVQVIGNSSLLGTILTIRDEEAKEKMKKIITVSQEINLSNDEDFNSLYVNAMYLKEIAR